MRTDVQKQIVSQLLSQKKYDGIREYLQVMFGQNDVVFESYDGLRPRLFKDEDEHIIMLLPNDMDTVMEGAVVDSIKDGTIFDDANVVNNTAKYIRMTTLPYNGLMNKNIDEPKALVSAVGSVVGTMNDEGRFGSEDSDLENGVNAMRDLMDHSNDEPGAPIKLVANYIDLKKNGEIPRSYRRSLAKIGDEVKDIDSVDIDDTIGPDDYRELKLTDECGSACAPVEEDAGNISGDEDYDDETEVKPRKEDAGNFTGEDDYDEDDDKVNSIKEEDDVTGGTDTNATSDTSTSSTTTDISATSASSDTTPEEVESSYSDNGTDNADVQQEGAYNLMDDTVVQESSKTQSGWNAIEGYLGFDLPGDFKNGIDDAHADWKKFINSTYVENGHNYDISEFKSVSSIYRDITGDNDGLPSRNALSFAMDGYGNQFVLAHGKSKSSGKEEFRYGFYNHEKHKIEFFKCMTWKEFQNGLKLDDDTVQEGFFTRKPKRLKPIPRDTIAYITVELNAIKDSNDQAMLAGYTCSKLELVDFYLNCIDTQDDRYIVPHSRQYLVQMQNELNALLTRILQIRPMNKMDRIWKPGVTLPDTTWR